MEVVPDVSRNNADSLLLFDSVPGNRLLVAELATPESLWHLLRGASRFLVSCVCQDESGLLPVPDAARARVEA
ncbi:hypothetical protein QJS66_14035 [Kocuria rhizophila]|nr:hypothetical protein QJS66_14035 [Kocuria rhizophila]